MIEKSKAIKNGVKILDNSAKNKFFENLKSNFPQTIKDGKADLKAISLLLGIDKKADISGYELTWTGKGLSNAMYSFPCNKELRLDEIYSNVITNNEIMQGVSQRDASPKSDSSLGDDNGKNTVIANEVKQSKEIDCHADKSARNDDKKDCYAKSHNDNPKNIIIRGDNLDALKILKSAYSEKIKMIYIDPPYNTANDNFIYPDNFREDYKAILREVGLIEIDENGEEIESENLRFFKNIQSSRTHSGWLSFMLPRLKLARDLLKEDGVIFISIDDNEQANLKILCDEIFGEDNFVASIPRLTSAQRPAQEKYVGINHDYILIYSKDKSYSFHSVINRDFNKEIFCDSIGKFFKNDTSPILASATQGYSSGGDYDVEFNGKIFSPIDSNGNRRRWLWTKERMKKAIELGIVVETKNSLRVRNYINKEFQVGTNEMVDKDEKLSATSFDLMKSEFVNDKGTDEVKELSIPFSFPKPINLIKILLQLSTSTNKNEKTNGVIKEEFPKALKVAEPTVIANEVRQSKEIDCHADKSARNDNGSNDNTEADIILDFFAGSGTTAQAVMELNEEDGGNRQFILVQIDEEIKEEKARALMIFVKTNLKAIIPQLAILR
ncbi:site-specific DNA-methyltransferase [Brachyspira sp.]|uniref:site-specific DNA-methyltransferase n=1 Tax=Brachyspira sp. TaxID=1977261 RepID=UPI003D7CBA61